MDIENKVRNKKKKNNHSYSFSPNHFRIANIRYVMEKETQKKMRKKNEIAQKISKIKMCSHFSEISKKATRDGICVKLTRIL